MEIFYSIHLVIASPSVKILSRLLKIAPPERVYSAGVSQGIPGQGVKPLAGV